MDKSEEGRKEGRMHRWMGREIGEKKEGKIEGRMDRRKLGRSDKQNTDREGREEVSLFSPEFCLK